MNERGSEVQQDMELCATQGRDKHNEEDMLVYSRRLDQKYNPSWKSTAQNFFLSRGHSSVLLCWEWQIVFNLCANDSD